MKKLLLLASLIAACATAPSPARTSPKLADAILFEIDHQKDAGDFVTSFTVVHESGAWTYRDSTGSSRSGQLSPTDLHAIATALHGAPWHVERAAITCMAYSAQYVDYVVDGKRVWTDRVCTPEHLDDHSRKQLDAAIQTVTSATKA